MTIEQNISDRKAAETLYRQAGELLAPEVAKLSGNAKLIFFRMLGEMCGKAVDRLTPQPQQKTESSRPAKAGRRFKAAEPSDDVKEAIRLAEEIEEMAGEVPERGEEYADSVRATAADIAKTIEDRGDVTEGQLSALENMHAGLCRWVDR